jgi:hypothetical protein
MLLLGNNTKKCIAESHVLSMTLNCSHSIAIQHMLTASTTSLKETTRTIEDRIDGLISKLIRSFEKQYPGRYGDMTFEINKGNKYYKIMEVTSSMGCITSRSVHAFVSRQTGAVYKPAGWKSPAKHVRYNLLDDASYANCLERADWAGGYLYIR